MESIIAFPPFDHKAFGQRLRAVRKAHKLSRATLGFRANIHPVTIASIEDGTRKSGCQAETVYNLAQALGVSTDVLYGLREE